MRIQKVILISWNFEISHIAKIEKIQTSQWTQYFNVRNENGISLLVRELASIEHHACIRV